MSKEVDNIIPFPKSAEPVQEQPQVIPHYIAEEEDEETNITIDFENQKIYSTEETWLIRDPETKEEVVIKGSLQNGPVIKENLHGGIITTEWPQEKEGLYIRTENAINVAQDESHEVPEVAFKDAFKNELQNIFMDGLTSKAVASLLKKHHELDTDLDKTMASRNMGDLGHMIQDDVYEVMSARRSELRACYNGANVRYENIPEWAKTYVRDYVRDAIHNLAVLTDK